MKRRSFIAGAVTTGTAAAALASPALAQETFEYKLVTTWPKDLPGLGTGAQWFADTVTSASGGRLTVQLFAAGEVVPAFEAIDAVASGTVQMGHGAPYYWKGKSPATEFVSNIPFGLTAQEYDAWYHFGGGSELCDEVYREQLGCKYLICGNTGVQHPGWSRVEIKSAEDVKGLKIRMPGLGGEAMQRLGATVVNVPGSEVGPALASGAIDYVEWNNPYGEASLGFWRDAKYYVTPGWHEPGTVLELFVNADAWDKLPDDLKKLVEAVAFATTNVMLSEFTARSAPVLQSFLNDHGVIINRLPDDLLITLGNTVGEVIADKIASDPLSRKVYASLNKFREEQMAYSSVADADFLVARNLPYRFPVAG